MKIEVNITKKYFFIIVGLLVITTLSFFAYAFNSGLAPQVAGHDSKEIAITDGYGNGGTLQNGIDGNTLVDWRKPIITPSFIQTTGPAATSYLQTTGNIYSSEQVIGAKGLCIGADCKSSWAQVGGGVITGGVTTYGVTSSANVLASAGCSPSGGPCLNEAKSVFIGNHRYCSLMNHMNGQPTESCDCSFTITGASSPQAWTLNERVYIPSVAMAGTNYNTACHCAAVCLD